MLFFDRRPAREGAWTERLWVYDLRTNMEFTLKQRPLRRADPDVLAEEIVEDPQAALDQFAAIALDLRK